MSPCVTTKNSNNVATSAGGNLQHEQLTLLTATIIAASPLLAA